MTRYTVMCAYRSTAKNDGHKLEVLRYCFESLAVGAGEIHTLWRGRVTT